MRLTILSSFCLFLLFSTSVYAQEKPEDITDKFFKLYETEGIDKAVDYVFSTNKWLTSEQKVIESIKTRLKTAVNLIGKYHGYEIYDKKILGSSFARLSFLVKYDRQPIQFTFHLYKPAEKWQVQSLKFDDSLFEDFETPGTIRTQTRASSTFSSPK